MLKSLTRTIEAVGETLWKLLETTEETKNNKYISQKSPAERTSVFQLILSDINDMNKSYLRIMDKILQQESINRDLLSIFSKDKDHRICKEGFTLLTALEDKKSKKKQKLRYCVIRGNEFVYYDDEPKDLSIKPRKSYSLDECTIIPMEEEVSIISFSFHFEKNPRNL